ncbi:hypothetical protein AGABI1DRAFT_121760 [Agaricus bisporus var. burnettii JB137-S8]|uniref:RRM domain-containing protein n=1 Tax=Agaricus bisporus var. burnettii (strain JB137-S8 / ATCC MYA-4627 / FGSC 10392) TaxID=597362 RepID=K5WRY2_AGABU|nr:uncharacterized protein AGABI1DRAFT_121760 [Agaricus bisporus var. burnettii JB137-S8]EKM78131.1 hypothetical protein AGABI1DRAFT_121760 [Agaricus bisporus var. burnettii JB137-S8]
MAVKSKSKAKPQAESAAKPNSPVKSVDDSKTPASKRDENEATGKTKKAAEVKNEAKKAKVKTDKAEQKPSKSKILAPPPGSDSEDEEPNKPQPKSSSKAPSSKQPIALISANANAKSSKQAVTKPTKSKQKAKSPTPPPSDSENASDAGQNEEEEEEVHLYGFSTDDDDSSDEDEVAVDSAKPGLSAFEVAKLPTVAKDDESVKRRLEKAKRQTTEDRGVVYIGRLPHGFYEDQLRGYFSQFGDITRLRISRNKKTGKSKHYGFIEFDSSSVAQIVAETMDNYLLTGHILRCKLIPKDEVHPELWIGANRKWRAVPRDRVVRVQQNKPRTREQRVKANKRLIKRQSERKRKLEELGIDYEFNAVGYKKSKVDVKA